MDRREIVRRGASVGATVIAGCLGGGDEVDSFDNGTTDPTSSNMSNSDTGENPSDSAETDSDGLEPPESGPVEEVSILDVDNSNSSDTTGMYRIIVENTGEENREFTVRVEHDGEVVFDNTHELAADTALELTADDVGTYATTVESRSARNVTKTTVSNTDCDSRTIISFSNEGTRSRNITHC